MSHHNDSDRHYGKIETAVRREALPSPPAYENDWRRARAPTWTPHDALPENRFIRALQKNEETMAGLREAIERLEAVIKNSALYKSGTLRVEPTVVSLKTQPLEKAMEKLAARLTNITLDAGREISRADPRVDVVDKPKNVNFVRMTLESSSEIPPCTMYLDPSKPAPVLPREPQPESMPTFTRETESSSPRRAKKL